MIQQFYSWVYNLKKMLILILKDSCTTMFIEMLFKIVKIYNQIMHQQMNKERKYGIQIHIGVLLSYKKQ